MHCGRGEAKGNLNGIPTDQNTGKENAGHNDEKGVEFGQPGHNDGREPIPLRDRGRVTEIVVNAGRLTHTG